MLIKIHQSYRTCIALCDKNLLGKKFEEGNKQLDLTGTFFQGEEKTLQEIKQILINAKYEDSTFNFVGQKSCNLAKSLGIISQQGIMYIDNIPIALVLM